VKLTRTVTFEAAHSLPWVAPGHKCANVHGHSWRATVEVEGRPQPEPKDEAGMVVDFGVIDRTIRQLDHTHLNDLISNPTSENVAAWIGGTLISLGLKPARVTVSETDRSSVEWTPADSAGRDQLCDLLADEVRRLAVGAIDGALLEHLKDAEDALGYAASRAREVE
jgi:6-pyruvoyltetrahydropterin/6-carboxytetrahydropterin synthase